MAEKSETKAVLKSVWEIISTEVGKEYQLGNFRKPFLFLGLGLGGLYYITDKIREKKKFPGIKNSSLIHF
jgi:hypothetical protein